MLKFSLLKQTEASYRILYASGVGYQLRKTNHTLNMELLYLQLIRIPSFEPSVLTSFRSLINVVWTKEGQVTEILKRACSSSTGVMVHLGTFLFTAFDSGSKVLTICTSLKDKHTKHSKPIFFWHFFSQLCYPPHWPHRHQGQQKGVNTEEKKTSGWDCTFQWLSQNFPT